MCDIAERGGWKVFELLISGDVPESRRIRAQSAGVVYANFAHAHLARTDTRKHEYGYFFMHICMPRAYAHTVQTMQAKFSTSQKWI